MAISRIDSDGIVSGGITADSLDIGQIGGRRNLIINGAMQVAQRGTSFTTDNAYTLDRWRSGDGTGGSPARTVTQETFTLGQTDVVGFHKYLRHDQTGASTNGNSSLATRIEDVTQFDGTTITVSFYAKADSTMTAQLRLIQDFGSGGSPSSLVEVNEDVSIGTSWQRYTVTKTLGSLSGKTLGTDGVHTSFLYVGFDFKPTTTFTFDITGVQLEVGDTATPFEHRSYGEELALCQRYFANLDGLEYQVGGSSGTGTSYDWYFGHQYPVEMRAVPTVTFSYTGNGATSNGFLMPSTGGNKFGRFSVRPSVTTECTVVADTLRLDAEL